MFKTIMLTFLLFASGMAQAQTCKDIYEQRKWFFNSNLSRVTMLMGGASVALLPVPTPITIPVCVGGIMMACTSITLMGIHDSKYEKMTDVIEESYRYLTDLNRPNSKPHSRMHAGVRLKTIYQRLKRTDQNIRIEDVAQLIVKKDQDLSLCAPQLIRYRELKKILGEELKNSSF